MEQAAKLSLEQRYEQRIAHRYFLRFHMTLILTAVVASGVLTSKALLTVGVHSLLLRYTLGVLESYLLFLLLVRVWIWSVAALAMRAPSLDLAVSDWGGDGSSSPDTGFTGFGGGSSGGGGASSLWESDRVAPPVTTAAQGPSASSNWLSRLNIDCDLDDGWILVLLGALVLAILGISGYLIYAAPQILPEAAWQAVLATTLTRVSKEHHHGWIAGVLRSTCIPFVVVLFLAVVLGWAAHRHCPTASKLVDVFHCQAQ